MILNRVTKPLSFEVANALKKELDSSLALQSITEYKARRYLCSLNRVKNGKYRVYIIIIGEKEALKKIYGELKFITRRFGVGKLLVNKKIPEQTFRR